ncbi:hypothetical protein AHA_2019 [Aeromonas hydrophila subsp. hydrophila ATCC 7966]|uniref:Uncharacterized protein n=1 Tax=Aeromonas hydrophila subsp. hydrophila (strain ATCC 7966 / DSM 30187 / BCRC 13018 / CCUG 14551 / JCM 1027 / KCTC 2358 / NCIMB 9240 / NCTC 8049) TaxID=380703 RepID=A0KJU8_AERHH|nr:hypothetical protein AHA_2019 [Aeromonas hydrophila subsp. hydrophila ATCC 7966]
MEEIDITPPSDSSQGGPDVKAELAQKAAERRAQQQNAHVIEGEAQVVTEEGEPVVESTQYVDEPTEQKDLEAEDLLAEILFKMDLAQSGSEMKVLVTEVTKLGPRLTDEQKQVASSIYQKNIDRLGLKTKKAA